MVIQCCWGMKTLKKTLNNMYCVFDVWSTWHYNLETIYLYLIDESQKSKRWIILVEFLIIEKMLLGKLHVLWQLAANYYLSQLELSIIYTQDLQPHQVLRLELTTSTITKEKYRTSRITLCKCWLNWILKTGGRKTIFQVVFLLLLYEQNFM